MFCISAIVKGAIWAVAVKPVIQMLGLGSIFTAWNIAKKSDVYDDHILKSLPTEEEMLKENLYALSPEDEEMYL